jgi:hypothetical protein
VTVSRIDRESDSPSRFGPSVEGADARFRVGDSWSAEVAMNVESNVGSSNFKAAKASIEVNVDRLKDCIKFRWRRLSEGEIEEGWHSDAALVQRLQERYGWDREEAVRQVREFRRRHRA